MKKTIAAALLFALVAAPAVFAQSKAETKAQPKASKAKPAQEGGKDEVVVLETKAGNIVIKFFPEKAPNHVKNFKDLARSGFYNGTRFHRVIPGFMIQGGDPNTKSENRATWGQGGNVVNGQEKNLKAEFNDIHHARGIVSMARAQDPNSASSQFFICVAEAGYLDGQYTVFGEVIEGMDVADKIVMGARKGDQAVDPVPIVRAKVEKRAPKAPAPKAAEPPKDSQKPTKAG